MSGAPKVRNNGTKNPIPFVPRAQAQAPTARVAFNPNDLDSYHCPHCGHDVFRKVHALRQVPVVISGTGKPELCEIHLAYECLNCSWYGTVPEMKQIAAGELAKHMEEVDEAEADLTATAAHTRTVIRVPGQKTETPDNQPESLPVESSTPSSRDYTDTDCPECGAAQFRTPSGISCRNGHGY